MKKYEKYLDNFLVPIAVGDEEKIPWDIPGRLSWQSLEQYMGIIWVKFLIEVLKNSWRKYEKKILEGNPGYLNKFLNSLKKFFKILAQLLRDSIRNTCRNHRINSWTYKFSCFVMRYFCPPNLVKFDRIAKRAKLPIIPQVNQAVDINS